MSTHAWVFIRGLTRGTGHWVDFLPMFRAKRPQDEFECLDLPGNGERFRERSLTDTAACARDLRARSRFVREGRKVVILGHSLGGMVAVEWAKQFPGDIERLFLMNTSCSNIGLPTDRFNPRTFPAYSRLLHAPDAYTYERVTMSVIANNDARVRELLPVLAAYTASHPVSWANAARQLLAASKARFPERLDVPVDILCSKNDRMVSVRNSLRLAEKWGVEPHVHPTAGHDIPVDDPEWLAEQLLNCV